MWSLVKELVQWIILGALVWIALGRGNLQGIAFVIQMIIVFAMAARIWEYFEVRNDRIKWERSAGKRPYPKPRWWLEVLKFAGAIVLMLIVFFGYNQAP